MINIREDKLENVVSLHKLPEAHAFVYGKTYFAVTDERGDDGGVLCYNLQDGRLEELCGDTKVVPVILDLVSRVEMDIDD